MIYNFNLQSKTILITGGYGYLGKGITESLLYHGAKVFVLGRSKEKFIEAFRANENYDKTLFFESCDIANSSSILKAFSNIAENNKIDVLINNAVYLKGQSPEHMSDEDWSTGIEGTLSSVFKCTREILPYMKKNKSGKIINVSSMYGVVSPDFAVYEKYSQFLNPPHYGAAKAGILQLTKYYASYLGPDNINVNAVTPGPFPSQEIQKERGFINELKKRTTLNRIGKPEDLAGAFVFLASDASNYITGQNFIIDGGWTIK